MVMILTTPKTQKLIFFREYTVAADVGHNIYIFMSLLRKRPTSNECGGGTNADNGAVANTCMAFIKVLNPGNGYAAEPGVYKETTGLSQTEWTSHEITVDITAAMVGWPLQFGFMNTGGNYAPTSVAL